MPLGSLLISCNTQSGCAHDAGCGKAHCMLWLPRQGSHKQSVEHKNILPHARIVSVESAANVHTGRTSYLRGVFWAATGVQPCKHNMDTAKLASITVAATLLQRCCPVRCLSANHSVLCSAASPLLALPHNTSSEQG